MRIFKNRKMDPGDPRKLVIWRWMDIVGPTGHENSIHEELYLRRLYVFRCPKFGVMVHFIRRPDWDRDALHDHPWEFWRFIVSGGYVETVAHPKGELNETENRYDYLQLKPSVDTTHKLWRFSKFPTGAYHRITSVKPHTVSLVITGPKTNSWGFFVPGRGHVPWREYVSGS